MDEATPPLRPGAIEALLRFLPALEAPGFSAGEWRGGERDASGAVQMPWFEPGAEASDFLASLGREGWIVVFDWRAWHEEARRLIEDGGLETAGIDDIRRLFTSIVRSDRFSEGQVAWAFESGLMIRILRRLEALGRAG